MILCPSCICVPFWLSCGPRPVCLCIVTRTLVRFLSSHPINKYTVFCAESMFSGPKIEMNQYHTYLGGMPSEISLSSIVLSNQCQSQLKTWYTSVFLWFVMMDFQYCELGDYVWVRAWVRSVWAHLPKGHVPPHCCSFCIHAVACLFHRGARVCESSLNFPRRNTFSWPSSVPRNGLFQNF